MSPLSAKRRIKRIIYSKPVVILLCLAVFFMLWVTWNAYWRMAETGKEATHVEERYAELVQKKAELEYNIEYLATPAGVEEELRKRFSAAKEGERMVVILDTESTSTPTNDKEGSFFKRTWMWLTSPFR